MIKEAIAKIIENKNLTEEESREVMNEIMGGSATNAQISAFLVGLRMKGETVDEVTGCAKVMREKVTGIRHKYDLVVDTCGTGGDCKGTFNISTTSAFVVAGAGVAVAKHGNRAISSACGSADLLQKLGVNIELPVEKVEACLNETGIGFLFAPLLHSAMKHAVPVRREIGIRTIFNILGPLTNPADAKAQVIGVFAPHLVDLISKVLRNLDSIHSFVVCGADGLDEVTITTDTKIAEVIDGQIKIFYVAPEDFGFKRAILSEILVSNIEESVKVTTNVLNGEKNPSRDIVIINSAYALVAGNKANDIHEGIKKAVESIDSGAALKKLELLREYTNK